MLLGLVAMSTMCAESPVLVGMATFSERQEMLGGGTGSLEMGTLVPKAGKGQE